MTLLLLGLPGIACASWWNNDWQFRKRLTIDAATVTAAGSAGLAEVTVPIRLHTGNFGYFNDIDKTGADLRFIAADDKTPLEFRLERLDAGAGIGVAWVKLPIASVSAEHSYLWMYYGAANAKSASSNQISDAALVASYDFSEVSGPPRDGTAYASNATSSTAHVGVPGVIDRALGFDAQSSVSLPPTPAFDFDIAKGTTMSAWIRVEPGSAAGLVYSQSGPDGRFEVSAGPTEVSASLGPAGREVRVAGPITDGWHLVGIAVGERLALYIDGTEVQGIPAPRIHLNAAPSLGASGSARSFSGALDDVRIAAVARMPGWFALEYSTQKPDTNAIVYGEDESRSSGGMSKELGLISRLLGSVTIDGWIVIALIAVVGLLSGEVLLMKLRQLDRAERGDRSLLDEFTARWQSDAARLAARPAAASAASNAQPDAVAPASPLQRLYARGIAELESALALSGQLRHLPAEYLGVIRSALDVGIVEETDSLNRRLVLMTIAVSGAPFLGLLGTVVGVMITFASIAATGDVNVNTIAPGVAAALFATVAGLLVAIPSLFGYNFIATRVGARVSAMDVFADQLVARFAAAFTGRTAAAEAAHAP
ncbi:MAG TPA: DUF2341 domain-containing protein [Steroidobacteraceae bacterium]|nr:DUF2341 domain-containing protein [Steroidobacteraceae bacterium]